MDRHAWVHYSERFYAVFAKCFASNAITWNSEKVRLYVAAKVPTASSRHAAAQY